MNDKIENVKSNKKKITSIIVLIIIILLTLLLIGLAYAYFSDTKEVTQNITSRLLNIEFEDGEIIRASDLKPLVEKEIEDNATTITFSVVSKDVDVVYYDISISDIEAQLGLKNTCFKWRLYETTNNENTLLNEGDFNGVDKEKVMVKDQLIDPKTQEKKSYKLQIWLSETEEDQSELMGLTFKGKVSIEARDRLLKKYNGEIVVINDSRNGEVPELKIYGKTDEEGKSVGEGGTINLQVTQNLINNGLGELCEEKNYSTCTDETYKSLSGFYNDNANFVAIYSGMDNTIYIDGRKNYTESMYVTGTADGANAGYIGLAEYDIDGKAINCINQAMPESYRKYTTLSKDLNDGDTEIYVEDASKIASYVNLSFWDYKDSTGHLYPIFTYTQNFYYMRYVNSPDDIDLENNLIKLKTPWSDGTFKKGSKIGSAEGTGCLNYGLGNQNAVPVNEWTLLKNEISGFHYDLDGDWNGANNYKKFFNAAKSVKLHIAASKSVKFSRVIFGETNKYEQKFTINIKKPLRSNGKVADYIDYNKKQIVRKIDDDGNVLEEVQYEDIELPKIPTYDGNTIIETTDDVILKPNLEVRY